MKIALIKTVFAAVSGLFFSLLLSSASAEWEQNYEVDRLVDHFQSTKRQSVLLMADLNEKEKARFWPLYDQFEKEMRPVVKSMIQSLYIYTADIDSVTDEQADQIIDALVRASEKSADIQKHYLAQFRSFLPAKKVLHISYVIYAD